MDERNEAVPPFDALVVGAGLSGLVVAHALQSGGCRVAVLESTKRAGGVIATRNHEGFVYETGPNSALDNTPGLASLLEALGIADQRIETRREAANRYVLRAGKLVALPMSPSGLLASGAFSIRAKLRLLREPFIARTPEGAEESVAEFMRRRLGPEILDYAADPFVSGIYAGDPARLSMQAAFPRLHALEQQYGSLLRGRIAMSRERRRAGEGGLARPRSFTFRDGMQTLPDALARSLVDYRTDTTVRSIRTGSHAPFTVSAERSGVTLELSTRTVIVATPAYAAAALIAPHDAEASSALESIPHAPVAIVASAYRRADVAHALDGFGMLVPSRERRRILGTLFSSSLFEGRAPAGQVLLTTFAGGRSDPRMATLDDAALSRIVNEELFALLGARKPLWNEMVRWPHAIPQYELGHRARVERIRHACKSRPGLFVCGSWSDGVSIGDRVLSGHAVANTVLRFLEP